MSVGKLKDVRYKFTRLVRRGYDVPGIILAISMNYNTHVLIRLGMRTRDNNRAQQRNTVKLALYEYAYPLSAALQRYVVIVSLS